MSTFSHHQAWSKQLLQLRTIKKGALSISEYLQNIKVVTDHLDATGYMVPDEEIMLYMLGGLGPDYDALVTSITTHSEPTDLDELHGFLFSHDLRIEHTHAHQLEAPLPVANMAQRGRGHGPNRGRGRGNQPTNQPNPASPGAGQAQSKQPGTHGLPLHTIGLLARFVATKITRP
ncbi:hypothetical protein MRB53_034459 [Persea americana]|uniref:Uncharacterized protein n=1 Tax=Persea americana TaxID=3435 RepID=A0ACC2K1T3_PERAE|nr:hypothetical protein MRB53_034459 [Persea americana]